MSHQARTYVREVFNEYRYWSTWTPLNKLRIGDYGPLEEGVFFKAKGHLTKKGVSVQALRTKGSPRGERLRFLTAGGASFKAQAAGQNAAIPGLPAGRAGAHIDFSRERATFMEAVGVSERRLADQELLEEELTALVKVGDFRPDYVVVTDVVSATSSRVFISTAGGQSVTIDGAATAGAPTVAGAELTAAGSASWNGSAGSEFGDTPNATPLFRLLGFRIGNLLRRGVQSAFSRRDHVPRIVVDRIGGVPTVGARITVEPIQRQKIAVAPPSSDALLIEAAALSPFAVEPVLVDTGVIADLSPGIARGFAASQTGIVLGSLDRHPLAGRIEVVRPYMDSAVLIDPTEADPFLAKMAAGQEINVTPGAMLDLDAHDPYATARAEIAMGDPLALEYVDFDAEFAASEETAGAVLLGG